MTMLAVPTSPAEAPSATERVARSATSAPAPSVIAAQVYRLSSLNEPAVGYNTAERIDLVGAVDPQYNTIDDRLALSSLVAALPPRERRIVTMRFCDEMTQERIAPEIGVSQMQVSTLLRHALAQLRIGLLASADAKPVKGPPDARH